MTTGQIYYRHNRDKIIAAVQNYWMKHPDKRKEYNRRSNSKKTKDLQIFGSLTYEHDIQKYAPENILFNDNFKAMINDSKVIREYSV